MKISNKQALHLEIKLNKSIYRNHWSELGDLLYSWRLHPLYYKIKSPLSYYVTKEQFIWILNNITNDEEKFKCYTIYFK
mgnify:CR=1 FL=1